MEDDTISDVANTPPVESTVLQRFKKNFALVQNVLDQNRLLINEIHQNHESKTPENLARNVGLIREVNNNIRKVVLVYADLSTTLSKSMEASSEGESARTTKSERRTKEG